VNSDVHCRHIVVDEMLSYINCYRDQSSHDCIRKVVLSFYSATEISDAKRHLLEAFDEQLLDCQLRADRRNSSSRPAHEAEVDDIFGILTFFDSLLKDFLFVAVNHERLPKYGPEEVNICTVVDRQVRLDAKFDFLAARLDEVSGSKQCTDTVLNSSSKLEELKAAVTDTVHQGFDSLQAQVTHLANVCSQLADGARSQHGTSMPVSSNASSAYSGTESTQTDLETLLFSALKTVVIMYGVILC